MVLSLLFKMVDVFCEYFKDLEEESVRDNFVIIYELLDEMIDFGYPQTTDSRILQEFVFSWRFFSTFSQMFLCFLSFLRFHFPRICRFLVFFCRVFCCKLTLIFIFMKCEKYIFRYITQEGHKLEVAPPKVPAAVTNAVSWRSEGIKYRKNEVFLDVIESVNMLVRAFFAVQSNFVLINTELGYTGLYLFMASRGGGSVLAVLATVTLFKPKNLYFCICTSQRN